MSLAGQRVDSRRYQVIPRTLIFARRGGRVLLQKVAADRGAWAGLWNGAGGHVAEGESPRRAAEREFLEETGLVLQDARLAGVLFVHVGSSPGIGVLVYIGEAGPGEPRANHEGELAWFTPEGVAQASTVQDLPTILSRALAVFDGDPPFTGLTTFEDDGTGRIRLDDDP